MMTSKRLYYQDAYKTRFRAQIVDRVQEDGRTAVILDHTYFYPTSGGQPHDLGILNDIQVVDVTIREADGAILHWVANDLWSDQVVADIDWNRRFDHMQQHTGQHILSQAFIQVSEAETVSFHLSDQRVTIDLEAGTMIPAHIEYAEHLANQIIWQNRPVHIRAASLEEAQELPLRKIPPITDGKLRLIEIEDFDMTACGGTHVAYTGEVGMIKIVRLERNGNKLRIEFCCGQRALIDYRQKNSIVNRLTTILTTGATEIIDSVSKLQTDVKEANRALKHQRLTITRLEVTNLLAEGNRKRRKKGEPVIITRVYQEDEMDPGQLRILASQLSQEPDVVALLGLAGEKSLLVFARANQAPGEMNQLIKPSLQMLGSASGGGTAEMAQGGGPQADADRVQQAIARAERLLLGQI